VPADFEARLRAEALPPGRWSSGPGERYAAHEHPYDKVLVVVSGSIRFGLPASAGAADLSVGDRLELPAQTSHDAVVGPDGVVCLESQAPAGTLGAVRRLAAGEW